MRLRGTFVLAGMATLIAATVFLSVLFAADADARRRPRGERHFSRVVARAQEAFKAAQYDEVLQLLAKVPSGHPLAPRARFLQAYAHYKLGAHGQAVGLLGPITEAESVSQQLRAEAGLLRAMISIEQQRWEEARLHLDRVIVGGEMPWTQTAERLRQRVDGELLQLERDARQRGEMLKLEKRKRDFDAAIAEAKKQIAKVDSNQREAERRARAALNRAERVWPHRALTRYYRGYLHYKQRQYRRARARLREALAIDPTDGWSRYMLALSIHDGGDAGRARSLLGNLAKKAQDEEVRQVARKALVRLEAAAVAETHDGGGLSVGLNVGSGIDSNPAYLDETPAQDPAMALQVGASVGYRHNLSRSFELSIGGAVVERAYLAGSGGDAHHTEPRGWASAAILGGKQQRLSLSATYGYSFVLYDHSPLLSQHVGELALWVPLDSQRSKSSTRLDLAVTGWGGIRAIHDARYNYFEATRAGASTRLRLGLPRLVVSIGYELLRDWAGAVDNSLEHQKITPAGDTTPGKKPGPGPEPDPEPIVETYQTIYRTDYTLIEHGPALWAEARLPWRLVLSAGAQLRWRRFDNADTVTNTDTNTTTLLDHRRDLRLSVNGEISRALPAGLELAVRFEQLRNWSSVASTELDRNYARYVGELVLRWRWGSQQ